jgi:hypothetical protein
VLIPPYPHAPFLQAGYRGTDALKQRPSLDVREMFALYQALPTSDEVRYGKGALDRLRRWEASHPALAKKYPADVILDFAESMVKAPR